MEKPEVERSASLEDTSQLTRNRSFKSKQLVRSQAIRESTSPPRTLSPNPSVDGPVDSPPHIEITPGNSDASPDTDRPRRRPDARADARSLLSNGPRVTCVCGACAQCPHCRGRRRKPQCPTKQDSGIVCSIDCADCDDGEHNGTQNGDGPRKAASVDSEEQTFYCRCPDRSYKRNPVGRSDSDDREPTGPDLVNFIKETLNKNSKDRSALLKIERELNALVNDIGRCIVRFPVMTSYGRMLVHRCASLYQLSHHLDQTHKNTVTVSKSGTSGGRIPCTSFKQWCTVTFPDSPHRYHDDSHHAKSILKRDTNSLDEPGTTLSATRSKSLEQREKEYERVRRRIFSADNCSQDESQWPWLTPGAPVKVLTPEGRNKLIKVQSLESNPQPPNAWRRAPVCKSHSFTGGCNGRLLSRQGDLASSSWRLSPSSSGYKTLSLRSTDSISPSPTGEASPAPGAGARVVWAVTDLSAVPPGAVVIHPQTGRPLTNPDGSVYHFDPNNPPAIDAAYLQDTQVDPNNEKRRGKLEKQHSFMDIGHEYDSVPTEEGRSKCCCECQHDDCPNNNTEKASSNAEENNAQVPTSPIKVRQENIERNATTEATNHKPPSNVTANQKEPDTAKTNQETPSHQRYEIQTNQRPVYETPANQRHYENQRYEPTNQKAPSYEHTNQRQEVEIPTNQRPPANKLSNQDSVESVQYVTQPGYVQYRNDDVTSPPQLQNSYITDMGMQTALVHAKAQPMAIQDPNLRPMAVNNIMYPTVLPQNYQYVNQCRMEPHLQPLYLTSVPAEDSILTPSPRPADNTFRIDPSYPYAPMEFGPQCGACVDPNAIHAQTRSMAVPYAPVECPPPVLPQPYAVPNVIVPQAHLPHYPQYEVPWTGAPLLPVGAHKLYGPVHDMCAVMHHPYGVVSMVPQGYPVCQTYPIRDKERTERENYNGNYRHSKRNSASNSSRNTPLLPTPQDARIQENNFSRQNSTDMATKLSQVKDQMSTMTVSESGTEDWRRRGGNGTASYNANRGPPVNDETRLTSAARAIVNSIRSMQAKNTHNNYNQDRRNDFQNYHRQDNRRQYRQERETNYEKDGQSATKYTQNPQERAGQNRVFTPHYRPMYLSRQQLAPGTWVRGSPAPVHQVLNAPRRPHPDSRNIRR